MKSNSILFISIFCFTLFTSCKQEPAVVTPDTPTYESTKKALQDKPGMENARAFMVELKKKIVDTDTKKPLLIEGLQTAEQFKMGPSAISYLMPLVKDYSDDPQSADWLAKLASALKDIKRDEASSILASAYFAGNPEGKFALSLKSKIGETLEDPDKILEAVAKKVFVDTDKYGINRTNAQLYVDACEAYALGNPKSAKAPEYLYKAGEMARTLRTYTKALSLYDWISNKYPDYEKTPTTLFLKGFMLENELNDKQKAKDTYNEFLTKYKGHDLTDDIKFLLQNIDKTDKEIMEMIEKNKKQ